MTDRRYNLLPKFTGSHSENAGIIFLIWKGQKFRAPQIIEEMAYQSGTERNFPNRQYTPCPVISALNF